MPGRQNARIECRVCTYDLRQFLKRWVVTTTGVEQLQQDMRQAGELVDIGLLQNLGCFSVHGQGVWREWRRCSVQCMGTRSCIYSLCNGRLVTKKVMQ